MFSKYKIMLVPKESGKLKYSHRYSTLIGIYKSLSLLDKEFSEDLHKNGFGSNQKYKLFNFTLQFRNSSFEKDYIKLNDFSTIILNIKGLNKISTKIYNAIMAYGIKIEDIEFQAVNGKLLLDSVKYGYKAIEYTSSSPIVCTIQENNKTKYLTPYDNRFYIVLIEGLKRKYKAVYKEDYVDDIFIDPEMQSVKKKFQKEIIKGHYIPIYAYDLSFWIEATPKMFNLIENIGVGSKNSMGFGSVKVIGGIK